MAWGLEFRLCRFPASLPVPELFCMFMLSPCMRNPFDQGFRRPRPSLHPKIASINTLIIYVLLIEEWLSAEYIYEIVMKGDFGSRKGSL